MAYKKDQGRLARMIAFWTLAVLIFYGCISLRQTLATQFSGLGQPIGDIRLPVLGMDLTPALIISALVLATGLFLLFRWQEKPKNAEILIETEAEMRRVTWPTLTEAINSSVVVILTVIFLMAFLAGADWMLGRATRIVLLGGGS